MGIIQRTNEADAIETRVTHCVICGKPLSEDKIRRGRQCCSISCGNKRYFRSLTEEQKVELRKKNSIAVKKALNTPEMHEKLSKAISESWKKDTGKRRSIASETLSSTLKQLWATEDYRQKTCDRISEAMTANWQDKDYAAKQKEAILTVISTKSFKDYHRKRTSEGTKLAYSNNKKDILTKIYSTKRANNSFNTSKPEQLAKELLEQIFDKVHYQYQSDLYPFNCDFYIEDLDLYIELNLSWTHGGRPFNKTDSSCIDQLSIWQEKAKTSKYYQNAIETWIARDLEKAQIARQNRLNWLCFYSEEDFYNYFNKGQTNEHIK